MKDPYLTPGTPCDVWFNLSNKIKWITYFSHYDKNNNPLFSDEFYEFSQHDCESYDNYRVIGTEWDYAPKWAVCRTVDADGTIRFWDTTKLDQYELGWKWIKAMDYSVVCGICPDKSQYEGDAWKKSMRERPWWAKDALDNPAQT